MLANMLAVTSYAMLVHAGLKPITYTRARDGRAATEAVDATGAIRDG